MVWALTVFPVYFLRPLSITSNGISGISLIWYLTPSGMCKIILQNPLPYTLNHPNPSIEISKLASLKLSQFNPISCYTN